MGRRRKKVPITLAPTATLPTPERMAHAGAMLTSVNLDANQHIAGRRLKVCTQIEWMHKRKQIDQAEYEAAERLFRDYYLGGLCSSGAVDPSKEPVDGGGQYIEPDRVMQARSSFNRAVKAMGPMTRGLVHDVVLENMSIKAIADKQHSNPLPEKVVVDGLVLKDTTQSPKFVRSGNGRDTATELRTVLCVGLDELAEHYGYKGKGR